MKPLAATFLAMLFVDTVGSVDPFGKRGTPIYLPAPRVYVATTVLWGLLGLLAGFGDAYSRLAGRIGAVVLLVAMVLGPFGKRAISFLNFTAKTFPAQEATS